MDLCRSLQLPIYTWSGPSGGRSNLVRRVDRYRDTVYRLTTDHGHGVGRKGAHPMIYFGGIRFELYLCSFGGGDNGEAGATTSRTGDDAMSWISVHEPRFRIEGASIFERDFHLQQRL